MGSKERNTAIFVLEKGTNNWRYKEFVMLQVKDQRWKMGKKNKLQTYESIYEVIDELSVRFNLHSVFKVPDAVNDVPSKCN